MELPHLVDEILERVNMAVVLESNDEFFSQTCNDLPLGSILSENPVEDQIFAPQLHAASGVLDWRARRRDELQRFLLPLVS